MTLKFYRKGRCEATLRTTTQDDYHLGWHYKAADGVLPIMENLQWALRHDDFFTAMKAIVKLKQHYDEIRIV